jgi:hypothetical protein
MSDRLPRRLWVEAPWHRTAKRYLGAMLVGNLVWEALHLPLYTLWKTGTASYLAFVVLHCSVGDMLIAILALFIAVILAGRGWPLWNYGRVALLTILFGLAYTIFSEWMNISVRGSWAYAAAMPVVPVLGTGLSPTLQWLILPGASLIWARREATGD